MKTVIENEANSVVVRNVGEMNLANSDANSSAVANASAGAGGDSGSISDRLKRLYRHETLEELDENGEVYRPTVISVLSEATQTSSRSASYNSADRKLQSNVIVDIPEPENENNAVQCVDIPGEGLHLIGFWEIQNVRNNWRKIVASTTLVLIGISVLIMGGLSLNNPMSTTPGTLYMPS